MAPGPDPVTEKAVVRDAVDMTEDDELVPLLSKGRRPSNTLCSCRYIVSYLVFLGFTCAFMNRVNISVAMTAMANSTYSSTYDTVNSTAELCPERSNETEETIREGEFPWDSHTQEQILASFYYGFPFFQIPAGLLADRYPRSCTIIIGVGYLISSISNLFIPLAAFNGGAPAIMALRIISGLAESGCYPCIYSLMSRWAPEADRSKLLAIAFAGSSFGQIIAQPISGILSESDFLGGWPSTFYLFGSLGILWYIPWVLLVYHSPTVHPRISQEERDYIVTQLNLTDGPPKTPKYPWKDFLTSMPLFAVCATDFALLWVLYSLTANLPIFLKEALRFDISQSGILASVPHIVFFFFIMGGGFLADFLLTHTKLSLTAVRKIMTTLGLVPSGAFLVLAGYVGCNATLVLIFISLGLATTGLAYSGASLTMMEFAPAYAGMVVAIANSVATIPGFVAPIVVAIYTENQADLGGWRTFFWISFGICMAAWVIFMIFGTSELQSWAKVVDDEDGIDSKSYTNGRAIESTDFRCSTDKSL
ncbi:putative inorganic phosphate cotransporter [Strongylocentrotus purpuratus]|uniref:Major facilitator superfamily (MFS) profile domain-containing protein n=1 Tax=Strongylocentrotus purpuratus TaxID=7668 RepID=A0A7M7NZ92_STRPU|nr:putative inorganic phosphate cotransporter [Strongylocentrotus purpuratus]